MTRPLGEVQKGVLSALRRHGEWSCRAGWVWDTRRRTERILESLVKRGLVERIEEQREPVWQPARYRVIS